MASSHADPRLSRLLAPSSGARRAAEPATLVAKQADGHGAVRFRCAVQARSHAVIPDGAELRVLPGGSAEWCRVLWGGEAGYVKKRNVVPAPAPAPAPAEAAPAAADAAPVPSVPTVGTTCVVTVNGTQYTIDTAAGDVTGLTTVHDWVDSHVPGSRLRRNCGIGFCGACLCMLSYKDPASGVMTHRAFNSCLRPILSCNGMAITTAAGVGSVGAPHPTQQALADHAGTQCGYCSAAVVMNLYSHLSASQGKEKTALELEGLLDSNICRCTGYRPILDAYKGFATKPPATPAHPGLGMNGCTSVMDRPAPPQDVPLPAPRMPGAAARLESSDWSEPRTEADLQKTLAALASQSPPPKDVWLVGGRTSQGIWVDRKPDVMVNVSQIASLRAMSSSDAGVVLGSGVTMSDAMTFLADVAAQNPDKAASFKQVVDHTTLSPGHTIRNMGTIGGNVMLSHEHQTDGNSFPLEWPLLFAALDATVTVVDMTGKSGTLDMQTFYKTDMKFKYLQKVTVPWDKPGMVFRSYRDSQRHVYSHALLAAAMRAEVADGLVVKGSVRIVYNNLGATPIRLTSVEDILGGSDPSDEANFQKALLPALEAAAIPVTSFGDVDFRKSLARNYFYKFMLALQPSLPPELQSATQSWLPRAVTSASQTFKTDPSVYPLNKAFPKMDSLRQVTGQAHYVRDLPVPSGCLHAAPVWAEQLGDFTIDATAAAAAKGFARILTSSDISAEANAKSYYVGHKFIADKTTEFIGHLVAIVLAETPDDARQCAKAVVVNYTNTKKPILTSAEGIAAKSFWPAGSVNPSKMVTGDVDKAFAASDHVLDFSFSIDHQYHYHMETQSQLAIPSETGLVLYSATQMPPASQAAVAQITGLPIADVDLHVRRCGGGFGGKLDNSCVAAQFCGWAAFTAGRPVRMLFDIDANMKMFGLRCAWHFDTKVGCNSDGEITASRVNAYLNCGSAIMPTGAGFAPVAFATAYDGCYNVKNWDVEIQGVKTNVPPSSAMRAPGWLPGIFSIERTIQCVAEALKMDPSAVRTRNLYKNGDVTPYQFPLKTWNVDKLLADVTASSGYEQRVKDVAAFNAANRWVKKGLSLQPSKFAIGGYSGNPLTIEASVTIGPDGYVGVSSGGVEIGQGLTTKVAQTVAYHLGCDFDMVRIQDFSTSAGMGVAQDVTGGSVTSEFTCLAAKNACDDLKPALDAAKAKIPAGTDKTWANIVAQAVKDSAILTSHGFATHMAAAKDPGGDAYFTCGAVVSEVTVDVLTGQLDVARCDILYDIGRSVNPTVDIGQIEGAFVIGAGYVLTEEIEYDDKYAVNWQEYKPPTPWEIPGVWNVALYADNVNPATTGGGKAIGEPPLSLAYSLLEAAERAVGAAAAAGGKTPMKATQTPLGITQRHKLAQTTADMLHFK
eukprot:TRINITY_DN756_c0_g2_i1.p2 TRINITY_DN756_c0_g2~~TRINITY_DN756_c0_g2_i1.p2  ORF type:complete len:1406 (+),score=532.77 TRINITY_DN756_c0_g2_i1:68-4285(+)